MPVTFAEVKCLPCTLVAMGRRVVWSLEICFEMIRIFPHIGALMCGIQNCSARTFLYLGLQFIYAYEWSSNWSRG